MPTFSPNPRRPDDDSLIRGRNGFTKRIVHLLVQWTPTCSRMRHLISEEMDRTLPGSMRLRMRLHYFVCCYCERYKVDLLYLRSVLQHTHEHVHELADTNLATEAKQSMKTVLCAEVDSA
jgi:hypothetical protein